MMARWKWREGSTEAHRLQWANRVLRAGQLLGVLVGMLMLLWFGATSLALRELDHGYRVSQTSPESDPGDSAQTTIYQATDLPVEPPPQRTGIQALAQPTVASPTSDPGFIILSDPINSGFSFTSTAPSELPDETIVGEEGDQAVAPDDQYTGAASQGGRYFPRRAARHDLDLPWTSYSNSAFALRVPYPNGWRVSQLTAGNQLQVTFTDPAGTGTVIVSVRRNPAPASESGYWQEGARLMAHRYGNRYRLLGFSAQTLGGSSGAAWQFVIDSGTEHAQEKLEIGAQLDGSAYSLIAVAPPENFSRYADIVGEMASRLSE